MLVPNRKDSFVIHAPNVGTLNKILIAHNNKGTAPGWFLDRVIVEDINRKHEYEFPCNRWLAKDEDDHEIARVLTVKSASDPVATPRPGKQRLITLEQMIVTNSKFIQVLRLVKRYLF